MQRLNIRTMPLSSDPLVLLNNFLVSFFVFRHILSERLKIGKNGWRNAEVVFLCTVAASFIGTASGLRIETARARLPREEAIARTMSRALINFTSGSPDELVSSFCRPFIPNSEKPLIKLPNPMEQADRERVCGWLVGIALSHPEPEHVEPAKLPPSPPARMEVMATLISVYHLKLSEYARKFEEVEALRNDSERSTFEGLFAEYSPWLASIALGLRLAKVFGEKKLEEDAAAATAPILNS